MGPASHFSFFCSDTYKQKTGLLVLTAQQQLFRAFKEYVGGERTDTGFQTRTHNLLSDRPTSAEASEVTSIRFSARKANTAAARTAGGGLCAGGALREQQTRTNKMNGFK